MIWKKMEVVDFKKNFPTGIEVPQSLIALLEYQETRAIKTKARKYSGHFYLYDKFWTLPPIVPPEIDSYFFHFGFDADGSVYSFWMYKCFPIEKTPIVFTGWSWIGNTLLANSLDEFLSLLSLGIEELGYAVNFPPDWVTQISYDPETLLFRNWLHENLGVSMPSDPLKIVKGAKNSHPDFDKWFEERVGFPPQKMKKPRR